MPRAVAIDNKASLFFNGSTSDVTCLSPTRSAGQPLTWGCIVRARNANSTVMGARNGSGAGQLFKIGITAAGLFQAEYDTTGSGGVVTASVSALDGRWHAVVAQYDGTSINFYVDGVAAGTLGSKPSAAITVTSFAYGKRADTGVERFLGNIVRGFMSPTAWTAAEIIAWSTAGVLPNKTMSFVHNMQDGAGTVVLDSSTSGVNATASATTWSSDVPSQARKVVGDNLVQNGSFEYAPPFTAATALTTGTSWIDGTVSGSATNNLFSWALSCNGGSQGNARFDTTNVNAGTYSLKLTATIGSSAGLVVQQYNGARNAANIATMIPIKPSTSYTLSGYITASGITTGASAGATIRVLENTATGYNSVTNQTAYINGTAAKQLATVTFTTNANTRYLEVGAAIISETGTAYFDDISLTETVPVPRATAQDFKASLKFDGSTSKVVLTQTAGLPVFSTAGYSVSGWFKRASNTTANALYNEANSANNTQVFTIFNQSGTDKIAVTVRNDANVSQLTGVSIAGVTLGTWNHFVWTDSNGTAKLYINGILDANNFNYTPTGTYTFNRSAIGAIERSTPANFYSGNLVDFKAWNRALTAAEVTTVYANGVTPTNNVGKWSLQEGAGTSALDTSGNANNGTITNGTYTTDVPSKKRRVVGGNLVNNGDFEFYPPGGSTSLAGIYNWTFRSVTGTTAAAYDVANARTGGCALKVSTTATGSRVFVYYNASGVGLPDMTNGLSIPPVIGTQYTCTYWMKTNFVSGSAATGARLELQSKNGAGATQEGGAGAGVTTTTGWTQYSFNFTATSSTAVAMVLVPQITGQDGTGTLIMDAWFDDISLTPTTNTLRAVAT